MEQYLPLEFVTALLEKLHIPSHFLKDPANTIPCAVDGGLRAMLFGVEDYARLLHNSPTEAKPNRIYRFYDEYLCHYIFFQLPGCENSYYFIGPYIPALPTEAFLQKKASQLSLTDSQFSQFQSYYRNLPVVEDENILLSIVDTLGTFLWRGGDFDVEYVSYEIPDKRKPIYTAGIFESSAPPATALPLDILEQTYESEQRLMEAVSKGKLHKVDIIVSSVRHHGTEERLPDSLRNRKNYLIILNTLLRKAAQYGQVHPMHIHRLSAEFAGQIEKLYSAEQGINLQKDMIRKYCLLVKEHSLKQYSPLIGRVITLVSYDLAAPLTLKHIAAALNVNASYLSCAFKKECGETLTAYVHRKRMEQAAFILSHADRQVQSVAEECGIMDVNYFIKVFKKHYGMTPSQYKAYAHP